MTSETISTMIRPTALSSLLVVLALLLTSGSVTSTPTGTSEGTAKVTDSGVGETVREDGVSPVSAEETVSLRDELLEALREGLGQLREEVRSKTGSMQSGFYGPPHHVHHYYHNGRPGPYQNYNGAGATSEELSALRQLLQATEDRLQATEYRLQTTESRLQTTEGRLQGTESELQATKSKLQAVENRLGTELDEPQATQSRPRSCEDKLIATQERLESAERKLALVDDTISNTDALSITVRNQGSTFVRWGRSQCPNSTHLIYSGLVGGSWYEHKGGPANRLCLSIEPEYDEAVAGPSQNFNFLHGVEYQDLLGHMDHDAPCSVCRALQSITIMVPATLTCPPGWVTQYTGHLVAGFYGHEGASEYLCLDGEPEHTLGDHANHNGALFYYTATKCGSLPCPPFIEGKVATCVVCSF